MREIKFRAWNKDWKMMVLPEDLQAIWFDGVTACAADVEFNITTTDGQRHKNFWEDCEKYEVMLMQYTGLKDKNGVEIYEGDMVQHSNITKALIVSIGGYIETYSEGHIANGIHIHTKAEDVVLGVSAFNSDRGIEVIGNIYQNPELLK